MSHTRPLYTRFIYHLDKFSWRLYVQLHVVMYTLLSVPCVYSTSFVISLLLFYLDSLFFHLIFFLVFFNCLTWPKGSFRHFFFLVWEERHKSYMFLLAGDLDSRQFTAARFLSLPIPFYWHRCVCVCILFLSFFPSFTSCSARSPGAGLLSAHSLPREQRHVGVYEILSYIGSLELTLVDLSLYRVFLISLHLDSGWPLDQENSRGPSTTIKDRQLPAGEPPDRNQFSDVFVCLLSRHCATVTSSD